MRLLTNERYKHIRREFHSVAWVIPQVWDLGVGGGGGVAPPLDLGEGPKGQISFKWGRVVVSPYRKFTKGSVHTWVFMILCIMIV